jgi:Ser/Thr protein kinase RdoA (MazF antagonist)
MWPADTCRMAKKPEPPALASWDVYKVAEKAIWLGTVEAPDKQAAVERAAQEFKTEVWRLYALARR